MRENTDQNISEYGHFSRNEEEQESRAVNFILIRSLNSYMENIFVCLFIVYSIIALSHREQMFLMRVHFKRYFSHHPNWQ